MKKVFTVSFWVLLLTTKTLFAQWTNLGADASGSKNYSFLAVSADGKNIASYDIGFNSSFQIVYQYTTSHDFGATWQIYAASSSAPMDMFWDGDVLYVQESATPTTLKKSTDFAASFTVQNSNHNIVGKVLQSPNGNWYKQYLGNGYSSSDKGITWTIVGLGGSGFMEYLVANNGSIVATFSQGVAYSTDGGNTWVNSTFSTNDTWTDSQNSISKTSDGTLIYLCKTATRVYKSTDNGVSWQLAASTLPVNPIKLLCSGNDIITLSKNGSTYKSTDSGSTFTQMTKINGILSAGAAMVASTSDIFISGTSGIYKYSSTITGIENETELAEVSLYPTPCQEILFIDSRNSAVSYSISNLAGQSVLWGILDTNQVSLRDIESGAYLLTLVNGEGKKSTKKIIKQ